MNDIEFLKKLYKDLEIEAYNSEALERLEQIIMRFENLVTLEQGYKVTPETKPLHDLITEDEEDKIREAHDRWEDKSD